MAASKFEEWLIAGALGPAAVALPVNWAAGELAGVAARWFKRLTRTDDLSRLVRAAGASVDLSRAEFDAVRRLLQNSQTWAQIGHGTVEALAASIASACLPSRDSRTDEESIAAARSIARGLLEFAVSDLEPELFNKLLLARLDRMQFDQARELDRALLALHADLAERLPPGPAQRRELVVYLNTLIDWLNTDPWPGDRRFDQAGGRGGPVLAPADIERKLRVTARNQQREQDLDADELAKRCRRLVILGGPGSGKTWLAKRTSRRCAEDALEALAAGGNLDDVELPLYTTCARLFSANGEIRTAVVSSALDQIADLGDSRVSAALHAFFTRQDAAKILLVVDSLDEADGPDDRLRQVDTLPWRIVLTSRPRSWNRQLVIDEGRTSDRVCELQPLRYPDDVEPFIGRWFELAERPETGSDLVAEIAQRPGLQQAATVPLILAFYCIVGGAGRLPDFRRDLLNMVLRCLLTEGWRRGYHDDRDGDHEPDVDACREALQAWAAAGATSDRFSGVGTWVDDVPTHRLRLAKAEREAVDHIAAPLGPARLDTGTTERRFIHRSIREHLVAEQVIGLSVEQAAETLLPHLWYDPDWDYSAPAAIANHPQKDQLLRHLIARALRCQPNGSGIIDASWEFRGLLARVACESNEADWSPDVAAIIGQARVELASSFHFDWQTFPLIGAGRWDASNRQANAALLRLLPGSEGLGSVLLVDWVVQLATTAEDKRQARGALLAILDDETDRSMAIWLFFVGVVKLVTTIEDKRQVRETLLAMLADTSEPSVRDFAEGLAKGVVELDATVDEKRQVREALLAIIDADRMHGNVGGQAQGVRRTARDAGRREPRLDGAVRPPMSWSTGSHGSPQQRTKSARPETRYSGGWPTRRTALRRNYWWTGSPGSWRVRRTSARPAKRYSRCCPM